MITDESINFFKNIPPFQFLDEPAIRKAVEHLSMEFFPKNSVILSQDGPPSDSLRIIKKGGVKVYISNEDEILIDYKSEGDSFGYLSLISGDKSRANVLAVEDTLCYAIPRDIILQIVNTEPAFGEYFMKSFFKKYLDRTYKEMRNKNLLFKEGEKLLYTTPVRHIISRSVITAPSDISIRDAANIMSEHRISSLVFVDEHNVPAAIVTDRDLRDRVVAKGADPAGPVRDIASTSLVSVTSDRTCFDALALMIQHNIHHLIVLDKGGLQGVVTNHDFMLLQGTSPLSILKTIDQQEKAEDLHAVHEKITQIISILLKEGVRATYIQRIITELHDRLLQKILDLSMADMAEPPAPFAFFVYGCEGRKEQTFKIDFHCAIVYEDDKSFSEKKEMEAFSQNLLDGLKKSFNDCGLPFFDVHPFGSEKSVYGDASDWEQLILNALRSREPARVQLAKKMLDLRSVHGDREIVKSLRKRLFSSIRTNYQYSSALVEHTAKLTSPIGFFKRFVVDEGGEHLEQFNVKTKGIVQIIDALRALAIFSSVYDTSTIDRLNTLSKAGKVSDDLRNNVATAFEFLLHLRLQNQQMKKDAQLPMDDLIDPGELSLLEKKTLKEIFQIIPVLQDVVKNFYEHQKTVA